MTTTLKLPRRKLTRHHQCTSCNRFLEKGSLAIVVSQWQGRWVIYFCNKECYDKDLDRQLNTSDSDDDDLEIDEEKEEL